MRGLLLVLMLPLLALLPLAEGKGIVLPPLASKAGLPQKALILVHGASINEKNYVSIAQAIQQATNLSLWVGLPSFILNTPNPVTITSAVTGMVSSIGEQGKWAIQAEDVYVAGHSLGGVFSPAVVNKQGYAGLLEFGSYVTNGLDIKTTKFPVLTLGGELDGLTRVSRIALEFDKMASLPAAEQFRKPVVVLPGVCHSQFCEGVNVTSFGVHDLMPEVTWPEAHAAIALASADFLHLQVGTSPADVADAKARFAEHFTYTQGIVGGFLAARHMEAVSGKANASAAADAGDWCAQVQGSVVAPPPAVTGGPYDVDVSVASNAGTLSGMYPTVSKDGGRTVGVVAYASYKLNPIDVSTVTVAAKSITCEMMSADQIAVAHLKPGSGGQAPPRDLCKAANDAAIQRAMALVSSATRARFASKGQPLHTVADKVKTTGPTFLASDLSFDIPSDFSAPVAVQAVSLATATNASVFPGVQMCIVLSPAKAAEWMLVDGLPKLA